ncbi:MAG: hypothetical protein JNK25_03695 [Phycisphaerae bacterium]|nr:hypothetical protein [Phycisphaerae bacterium]
MPSRGVLYVVWDRFFNPAMQATLDRSIASVKQLHPELPVKIHDLPKGASLVDKAGMMEWTPFDTTLFLDADTVVLDRLDFGFEMAERHHLACCICEAPYARRYPHAVSGDLIEYNTGVLFFDRAPLTRELFARWAELARTADSRLPIRFVNGQLDEMPCNDQCGFAMAVHELAFNPFVLPLNWNLRAQWQKVVYGPIKVWHSYEPIPPIVGQFNAAMQPPNIMNFVRLP